MSRLVDGNTARAPANRDRRRPSGILVDRRHGSVFVVNDIDAVGRSVDGNVDRAGPHRVRLPLLALSIAVDRRHRAVPRVGDVRISRGAIDCDGRRHGSRVNGGHLVGITIDDADVVGAGVDDREFARLRNDAQRARILADDHRHDAEGSVEACAGAPHHRVLRLRRPPGVSALGGDAPRRAPRRLRRRVPRRPASGLADRGKTAAAHTHGCTDPRDGRCRIVVFVLDPATVKPGTNGTIWIADLRSRLGQGGAR